MGIIEDYTSIRAHLGALFDQDRWYQMNALGERPGWFGYRTSGPYTLSTAEIAEGLCLTSRSRGRLVGQPRGFVLRRGLPGDRS